MRKGRTGPGQAWLITVLKDAGQVSKGVVRMVTLFAVAAACSGGSAAHPLPPPAIRLLPAPDEGGVRVRVVKFHSGPYALALGFGSLWISDTDGVTRVNPNTGRVTGRVEVPSEGEWSSVAVGAGSVWYLDSPGAISKLSPVSLRVTRTRRFGAFNGTESFDNLAVSTTGVCADRLGSKGSAFGAVCFSPDIRQRSLDVAIPLGAKALAATTDGRVWIGGRRPVAVRPASRRVAGAPILAGALALAVDGSTLWAATPSGSHSRIIAVQRDHVVWSVTTGIPVWTIRNIAVAARRVWMLRSLPHHRAVIGCVSPTGVFRSVVAVSGNSLGLAATSHAVWTVDYRDRTATLITY